MLRNTTTPLTRWVLAMTAGVALLSACGPDQAGQAWPEEFGPLTEVRPEVVLDGVGDVTQVLGHRVLFDEVELQAQSVSLSGPRARDLLADDALMFSMRAGDTAGTAATDARWWDLTGAGGETLSFRFGDDEEGFSVRVHGFIARTALDHDALDGVDGSATLTGSSVASGDPDGIPMTAGGDPDGIPMSGGEDDDDDADDDESGDPDGIPMKSSGDPDGIPMDASGDPDGIPMKSSGDPDGIPMDGTAGDDGGREPTVDFIDPEDETSGDPDGIPMDDGEDDDGDDESGDPDGIPMDGKTGHGEVGNVDVGPNVDGTKGGAKGHDAPGDYGNQMLQDQQRGGEQDLVPFVIVIPESFLVEATLPYELPSDEALPLALRVDARLLLTDSVLERMRDLYDGENTVVTTSSDSMAFALDTDDEEAEKIDLTGREPRPEH